MKTIKSFLFKSLAAVAVVLLSMALQSSDSAPRSASTWHPMRTTAQEMQEKVAGISPAAVWLGSGSMLQGVDNMGNWTTCRIPIIAGTQYMYFNSMYNFQFKLQGNGYSTLAISSDNGEHFDAVVICLPQDLQAMIGSDGCIEVSYRYAGSTPGQFVLSAVPAYSMFK